ncbi:uroporphyrinogen decarboxylase family protein [Oscillospiraceae bacterium MB08-C2-2]|nr:uroporphyrinogen decarboxylase family protein [Oscillospiraceae bacterium MB08-C2-2]
MTHRQRVLAAFNNQPVDRVPFSFWFHFMKHEEQADALANPELLEILYEGHKHYMEALEPDFVKIMCDGLFRYPSAPLYNLKTVEDLAQVTALDKNNPWIRAHIDHVKRICSIREDACYFYNIFSPSMLVRLLVGEEKFLELFRQVPQKMGDAFLRMGESLAYMAEAVIKESGADGIFLCVQNQNVNVITDEEHRKYFSPSDRIILDAANAAGDNNILHICGYEGRHNNLEQWVDYEAKAYNWATYVEGVTLGQGKKLFGGKAVIGGFQNTVQGLLNTGTKEELEAAVEKILEEAGRVGVLIGPDCSLPHGLDIKRLEWVRDKLAALGSAQ